jgi:hypothetical protein
LYIKLRWLWKQLGFRPRQQRQQQKVLRFPDIRNSETTHWLHSPWSSHPVLVFAKAGSLVIILSSWREIMFLLLHSENEEGPVAKSNSRKWVWCIRFGGRLTRSWKMLAAHSEAKEKVFSREHLLGAHRSILQKFPFICSPSRQHGFLSHFWFSTQILSIVSHLPK